ncbi:MAG TPA: hypothetical protein VF316_25320 [Polyangiaceae bacterium]
MTRPHTTPADHPTTQALIYLAPGGRSPGVGASCFPADHAARTALETAKATGKPVYVHEDAHGEPIARVTPEGALHALATEDEIRKMTPAEYRANADADARAWLPIGENAPATVKALAASMADRSRPNPADELRRSLGAFFLRAVGG